MKEDRRGAPRGRLRRDEVPGRFYLIVDGESFELDDAHDVSVSGMGITLARPLAVGTSVRLGYEDDSFRLELGADVAWCEPQPQGARLGLRFSPDPLQADDNALFFMTLREYLDDFDALG